MLDQLIGHRYPLARPLLEFPHHHLIRLATSPRVHLHLLPYHNPISALPYILLYLFGCFWTPSLYQVADSPQGASAASSAPAASSSKSAGQAAAILPKGFASAGIALVAIGAGAAMVL